MNIVHYDPSTVTGGGGGLVGGRGGRGQGRGGGTRERSCPSITGPRLRSVLLTCVGNVLTLPLGPLIEKKHVNVL